MVSYKHMPTLQLSGNPVILKGFSGALANWPSWIICILHPARSWREVAVGDRKQWYVWICTVFPRSDTTLVVSGNILFSTSVHIYVACEKGSTHLMPCIWRRGVFACTKWASWKLKDSKLMRPGLPGQKNLYWPKELHFTLIPEVTISRENEDGETRWAIPW